MNFDASMSKRSPHTLSICMLFLIKLRTRDTNLRWKAEREMVLVAILMKNCKNGQKLEFGPLCLENLPRYDIDSYVVSYKVDNEEFDFEEKTRNGNSYVCHFDENGRKSDCISLMQTWGPQRCPRSWDRLRICRVIYVKIKILTCFLATITFVRLILYFKDFW